jgi:serine/threonine-protein phosphatase 2A regulatory subunit B
LKRNNLRIAITITLILFLSLSPGGENFLSADDLRVNLWSLENSLLAFNIVDLKPQNIEELAEVITHVEYHH